ncbi:family 5 glycoside hydrolase [Melampsora larici-populina 98AG31]|uniref:Family 5 glycoside hydrolase n=1 Tax=Melampsora larici-populina (strain 98AG31 / pathotype 3-4-7) TaxID=747676 RepID=F4R3V8_MELLP|nr:family 5 glycoside hydrolase [Melampsora larici-populina 98AG31]EGG12689.1 family 5 glycoside hydrolase [Melampsora larici-populina 98AG31]
MPPPSRISTLTGNPVPDYFIHSNTRHFRDTLGRTLILRGVNLCSSAKVPKGHPHHLLDDFWENSTGSLYRQPLQTDEKLTGISYVGQNLDLEDGSADIHLIRLKQWGFNVIRFVTVWEALEHRGPGQYDFEYMDYVVAVLRKCKQYGFRVYMDPHQDLFSRFCGGSGAPLWTLYACGLNPRHFSVTGAAYLQAEWPHPSSPKPESLPSMIWATNYNRLACQTVNTMFWAGRDYAPKCIIDGINIQDYLQYHFLEAYRRLGLKISEAGDLLDETVIGWDSLNEPNHGYLGIENLLNIPNEVPLKIGPSPTPIQGMRLGMGESMKLENYRFGPIGPQRDGSVVVDPEGKTAWLNPGAEPNGRSGYGWKRDSEWKLGTCIWAQHGVWDLSTGNLLKPDYFAHSRLDPFRKTDFASDYWRPHLLAWCSMIREIHPESILFVHPPVFEIPPDLSTSTLPILKHRSVFSSHFYDGLTLVTRHWNWFNADALGILRGKYPSVVFGLKIGEAAIRRCLRSQLGMLRQDGLEKMGEFPTMMGEIGIPYDLDKKQAYKDGDYGNQIKALDASLNACDGENMLNYTIWTYCPDNSHQWGDLWNGEDLSLWSLDDSICQGSNYSEKSNRSTNESSTTNGSSGSGGENDGGVGVGLNRTDTDLNPEGIDMNLNLNDGARGLAAFCRPFPIATVGEPIYFNFDIASATFEMTVEVNVEEEEYSNQEEICTEIYVPAAHFGAKAHQNRFSINRHRLVEEPLGGRSNGSEKLQIEVTISGGRWESEGQLLRWYYPRRLGLKGKMDHYFCLKIRIAGRF